MSGTADTLSHLVTLLEEAKLQAARLGPTAGNTLRHLDEALTELRGSAERDGRPDEGVRLQDLTTDNDK